MKKRAVWGWIVACLVPGLCFCQVALAEESCIEDVVCIETIQEGTDVEFFVRNLYAENLVVMFEMEMTNMVATVQFPHSTVYPAHARTYAFTLSQNDCSAAWHYQYTYIWTTEPEKDCFDDVACVTPVWRGNQFEFLVENRQATNLTITFTAELENMTANVEFPYTATYLRQQTTRAFALSVDDASATWQYDYHLDWTWGNLDADHDDGVVYVLPYQPGTAHEVIQGFNDTFSHFGDNQYALDWAMPEGTPVCAARSGIVVGVETSHTTNGLSEDDKKLANYIRIQHADGTIGEYAHLQPGGAQVQIGQNVEAGDIIGFSGNTGYSTRPHLHFFVYKAIDGKRRQSFPIKFRTREQTPTTLEEGKIYTAY